MLLTAGWSVISRVHIRVYHLGTLRPRFQVTSRIFTCLHAMP